jgi:Transcriptional regulators
VTASSVRSEPPYARIVAEIRRRIEAGELRPGDRIPSARQITKEWGVAIATATKVLAALRQEGLVRPRPGVGTVVAEPPAVPPAVPPATPEATQKAAQKATHKATVPAAPAIPAVAPAIPPVPTRAEPAEPRTAKPAAPRRAARDPDHELTRDRIVRAGIEIADAEGLAALSMRRIATALDVATMSLYRHVPSKDELVILMYDAVFGAASYPDPPPESWRECLELGARTQWSVYRRHPWVAQAISFTRPIPTPHAIVHTEWLLRSMDGFGLSDEQLLHIAVTIANYVRGTAVNFALEAEARRDTGITYEEWMEEQDPVIEQVFIGDGRYPVMARIALQPDVDLSIDSLFEFGLTRLLDGIEVLVAGKARRSPATPS